MKNRLLIVALLIAVLALCLAACGPKDNTTYVNTIVNGVTTEPTGDWYPHWTNNGTDYDVYKLTNGYATATLTSGGEYVVDTKTVLKSDGFDRKEVEGYYTYNAEGEYVWVARDTITYTFELNTNLKYSDGTAINAYEYAFAVMYFSSWAPRSNGGTATAGYSYIGFSRFSNATKSTAFSGITIHNDYKFSVTIDPNELPYYYELGLAAITPMPMHMWLKDCNVQITLDENKHPMFSDSFYAASNKALIEATREHVRFKTWESGYVGAGPYRLVSFDKSARKVTLEINKNYLGDYQGKKPSINRIIVMYIVQTTMVQAWKDGTVDLLAGVTDGATITNADSITKSSSTLTGASYLRNGYGKIMFVCDYGPTQFVEVRQAIAHLIDRNEFATAFTKGYGSVVHGPYGLAMWMYQDNARLQQNLEKYSYSVTAAEKLLNDGGWKLDANGNTWNGTGLRYKDITNVKLDGPWEEDNEGNVILDNEGNRIPTKIAVSTEGYDTRIKTVGGKTLMPLELDYIGTVENEFTDLIVQKLCSSTAVSNIGMKFNVSTITFANLLLRVYRQEGYETPASCMYNLATNFTAVYDQSYEWSGESYWLDIGANLSRLFDLGEGGLDQLSMDMVYGCNPTQRSEYLRLWTDYILRWNELLPELPMYSNTYYDFHHTKLKNYNPSSLWEFDGAIVYAYVEGHQNNNQN